MTCTSKVTSHKNHHSLGSTFPGISLFVKYLAKDAVFKQHLGRDIGTKIPLCNIFGESTICILSKLTLENYLNCVRENWQNVNIQASSTRDDDVDNKVEGRGRNNELDTEN